MQLKQQMGGRLARSDPHSSTELYAPTSLRGNGAPWTTTVPWHAAGVNILQAWVLQKPCFQGLYLSVSVCT